jgi:hypothetical protein
MRGATGLLRRLSWRVLVGTCLTATFSCDGASDASDPAPPPSAPAPTCPPAPAALRFADPRQAFTHYAKAINAQRWCDAIAAFAPEQRANLVVSTFKGTLLAAGLDGPHRPQHYAAMQSFCRKHRLDYSSAPRVAMLASSIYTKKNVDNELLPVRRAAQRSAESMYAELMAGAAAVSGNVATTLELQLEEVVVSGDQARGIAMQSDGRKIPVPFIKTSSGWLLSER